MLHTSGEYDKNHDGVAVILKIGMEKCLIEWDPIKNWLMKIRMKGNHINVIIIQCYVPTNDSEEESKNAFCDQSQAELEYTSRREMKIVMGD